MSDKKKVEFSLAELQVFNELLHAQNVAFPARACKLVAALSEKLTDAIADAEASENQGAIRKGLHPVG